MSAVWAFGERMLIMEGAFELKVTGDVLASVIAFVAKERAAEADSRQKCGERSAQR